MARYRERPAVVEAKQWDGSIDSAAAIEEWSGGLAVMKMLLGGKPQIFIDQGGIVTMAAPDDWIVCDREGRFNVMQGPVFTALYEPEQD